MSNTWQTPRKKLEFEFNLAEFGQISSTPCSLSLLVTSLLHFIGRSSPIWRLAPGSFLLPRLHIRARRKAVKQPPDGTSPCRAATVTLSPPLDIAGAHVMLPPLLFSLANPPWSRTSMPARFSPPQQSSTRDLPSPSISATVDLADMLASPLLPHSDVALLTNTHGAPWTPFIRDGHLPPLSLQRSPEP